MNSLRYFRLPYSVSLSRASSRHLSLKLEFDPLGREPSQLTLGISELPEECGTIGVDSMHIINNGCVTLPSQNRYITKHVVKGEHNK
jgi:hypothetical protein